MLKTLAIVLSVILVPAAAMAQQDEEVASAAVLRPGQYLILCGVHGSTLKPSCRQGSILQTICIKSNNTWHGTMFANWGGDILSLGGKQTIFGNYLSGFGNDSFDVKGKTADWIEWRDDLSFKNFLPGVQLKFQGTTCGRAPTGALAPLGDPSGPNEQ